MRPDLGGDNLLPAPVRLKWHQLRREPFEPPARRSNLAAGLIAGASMEVDLRMLGDGRCVCLHDSTFDRETTGSGPILAATAESLPTMRMRDARGVPGGETPMLLDELLQTIEQTVAAPAATVQLDLKEHWRLPAGLTDSLQRALAPFTATVTLASIDARVLRAVHDGLPALRLSLDLSRPLMRAPIGTLAQRIQSMLADAPALAMVYVRRTLLPRLLSEPGDPVRLLHDRGIGIDCGTISVGDANWRRWLALAQQAGVDQLTTESPDALAAGGFVPLRVDGDVRLVP